MSATSRGFIRAFTVSLSSSPPPPLHSSNSTATVVSRFLGAGRRLLPLPPCFALSRSLRTAVSPRRDSDLAAVISSNKHKGQKKWKAKKNQNGSSMMEGTSSSTTDTIIEQLTELSISGTPVNEPSATIQFGNVVQNQTSVPGLKTAWEPRSYGTTTVDVQSLPGNQINVGNQTDAATVTEKKSIDLSAAFRPDLLESFNVDNTTYSHAQIRATFYPKFENEKSDQEVRARMIEMVSRGLATLEVSLKHSGSLFMYAGHEGGAYAKNSFGNIYTAVGTFVLGTMFHESWGALASKKQADFNEFLENNRMCVSMELVTAVLGDHGQRPKEDYVVVTAVTELGHGKPRFYSTPEIITFCREWRLPTNHVWLFSTRKSVTSFFAAFDALCEEGTATPVCKALDEVADISVPGSKDHIKSQGEILEGLVARIVSRESSKHMEDVLRNFSIPPVDEAGLELGPNLREICAANRSDEKQQVKALLEIVGSSFCPDTVDWFGQEAGDRSRTADKSVLTKFLQAHPADYSTKKLQEIVRLMREKRFPAAFKCYYNFHKVDSLSKDNLFYRMVIHVHSDSAFRRYQKEMRHNPQLWPLYRGFFVDINLFKANKERAAELAKASNITYKVNGSSDTLVSNDLADEDANLMIKLKFLTYKLRTFLIRNGLSVLFKEGPSAYRNYYLRQMNIWGTSAAKQRELSKMLDEWAVFIRRKCGNKQLSSDLYLSEAEPFLEQYAKRSPANQALIGSAGNLVRSEDFLAIIEGVDEEGDLGRDHVVASSTPVPAKETVAKQDGLIVFFPGIPGCAKSALCKEILTAGGLGDDRPVHSLMGDLIKGRYWQKIAEERRKKPYSIILADKNAPNEEVWRQIEDMCRSTRASAVPVIPDSEGTDSNPFSIDALAVFIFRVLQRVNHPGSLDKASPNAGYVLLMFYHLYEGKDRKLFEAELMDRFGSLVKMPLLKSDRNPLPDPAKSVLEEGINLYKLHVGRHGRLESTKGTYANEWAKWEKKLRETLLSNAEYLNDIQVPFEFAAGKVLEQLKEVAKGDFSTPSAERKKLGTIFFAAVSLPVSEVQNLITNISKTNTNVQAFIKDKRLDETLTKAHVTLAHKRSHGVVAVANYGQFLNRQFPVELTAFLFSDKLAALEARLGSIDGEKVDSLNEWPHVTVWFGQGASAKDANTLPQLLLQGKANRVEIDPPSVVSGEVRFF
ncbi:tRNA ligase 1-like protein [Drosera capensis]